jgi:hypothetical protein
MNRLLVLLIVFTGQMNTLQEKPVVHLPPHQNFIAVEFGGDLVELINAPAVLLLPKLPPTLDAHGSPWTIEVKNLGPGNVTIVGKSQFNLQVNVGQTVRIKSSSTGYSSVR